MNVLTGSADKTEGGPVFTSGAIGASSIPLMDERSWAFASAVAFSAVEILSIA